ncbi:hypothetical protein FE844_008860 [Rhizobium indicum]|uniref:hypothetical protein n=1 Tax=Rhizobium indicum TaxID=2583231 RepID=UPI001105EFB1|nr:hypothetical protein [Rhizobium indicum]QKK29677.1 hypothetical protein FE844_008860 [Rhizobium indicum]
MAIIAEILSRRDLHHVLGHVLGWDFCERHAASSLVRRSGAAVQILRRGQVATIIMANRAPVGIPQ